VKRRKEALAKDYHEENPFIPIANSRQHKGYFPEGLVIKEPTSEIHQSRV